MDYNNCYDSDDNIVLFDSDNEEDFIQGSWEIDKNETESEITTVSSNVICEEEKDEYETTSSQNGFIERMKLNDQKAGMEGLDKEKINRIIHDASKGSKFYENEKRKEERVKQRVSEMKNELKKFNEPDKKRALIESNKVLENLKKEYDFSRTIVHIDMDAFYAAVEMRDNPELQNVPMAVGGNDMLSTSNYLARKYGVRAAMPGFIAKKLCPELVIVPQHFDKYKSVSAEIRDIFHEYDPNFSPMSLDEAYLDLTDYLTKFERPPEKDENNTTNNKSDVEVVVEEIRTRIFKKTKLTASAGIAPNLMLSKICSDLNKPNGQYFLKPNKEIIEEFVRDLPIRKVFGIGRVTEQMLLAIDVKHCRDLLTKRDLLCLLFSSTSFTYFMRVALGISHNRIVHDDRKSMSVERTFKNESNKEKLLEICRSLCEELSRDLKKEQLWVRNVTLKYKLSSFVTRTRSKSLPHSISKSDELYIFAKELLTHELQIFQRKGENFELRLMGVRGAHFFQRNNLKQNTVEEFFKTEKKSKSNDIIDENTDVSSRPKNPDDKPGFSGSSEEKLICPVCGIQQRNGDLVSLNSHIDSCLTKQTIQRMIKEQDSMETKQKSPAKSGSSSKKRKSNEQLERKENKKTKTLMSYWKK